MALPSSYQSFIASFYAASDASPAADASANDAYVSHFLPHSTMIMGPITYEGHAGLHRFREAGWEKVALRKHVVKGVFPSLTSPDELMLYGTVDYGMKDGSSKEGVEWAARMVFADPTVEAPKLKFYQVYITQR